MFTLAISVWPLPICLDSWTWHTRFLCNIALYSIGPCFYHQSHPQLGIVFALAPSTQKDVLFIIGDWNAKVGSQETPGVTGKFGLGIRNEAGQRLIVLPRKCAGHSKHPLPTTQEKTLHMAITRWSTPKSDWLYSLQPKMEKLYTVNKNKTRSWLWLRSWTPHYQIQT